jgi:hypothetical protein
MSTIKKGDRDVNIKFNQIKFNKEFEEDDNKDINYNPDLEKPDEIISKKLPHQKSIEDIIILSRDMIYKLLEMMMNRQDTMAYINSSPDKQFTFALILIFFGTILLLLSGLMMDK